MSSELQLFCYSQKFLYRDCGKFLYRDFYIFKKNELVLSSPKKFGEGFPRFRRGIFAFLLFLCSSNKLISERDPVLEFPYRDFPVPEFFFFFGNPCTGIFRIPKKKGGRASTSVIRLAPLAKTHWIFFVLVLDPKKME